MARQAIASYVDEIVIDPGEKTATLAVNAGFGPPDGGAGQQKPNDPPQGGSQVTGIEVEGWSDDPRFGDPET